MSNKGELKVTVVEASGLKDKDTVGKSDPYIELYIDKGYKQKTTTKEGTLSPVWNENFKFNINNQHTLYLKVLDKDITDSDKIGETKVDLKEVFSKGYVDTWVNLPALLGLTSHGKVHLVKVFAGLVSSQWIIMRRIVEAKNLKDTDFIGKSDPYVELWIEKGYKQKTTVKDGTLNPVWNEDFKFNIHGEHTLHLKVLDKDITEDDKIGEAKVDLKEVFSKGYVDDWFKLPALLGLSSHGQVHLVLQFTAE
ncbi:5461_t:CDS:2 [Ambispora gerdemannii]|uniref:5461_t:CDS:1 n=1 Tax=Ambispora gerdemannii TaxID=144530 RepID=A0A9N9C2U4_9GLOM|nr:5461_t:CDS:2 [Ambispora gerdemannii]